MRLKTPEGVANSARWQSIKAQRLRARYWWAASTVLKAAHWVFAIATVVVTGVAAGRPGFIHQTWSDSEVTSWSTMSVILASLSGLVPWQQAGASFGIAHEKLADEISIFDDETGYSVRGLVEFARKTTLELYNGLPVVRPGHK